MKLQSLFKTGQQLTQFGRRRGVEDQQGPAFLVDWSGTDSLAQPRRNQWAHGVHPPRGFSQTLLQSLQGLTACQGPAEWNGVGHQRPGTFRFHARSVASWIS
jgi:hypothetical protein